MSVFYLLLNPKSQTLYPLLGIIRRRHISACSSRRKSKGLLLNLRTTHNLLSHNDF